jgi:hypothetical protein
VQKIIASLHTLYKYDMVAIWYSSRGPDIARQELGSAVLTETRNANAYNPPDTFTQPPEVGPTGMEKVQAYR